MEDKKGKPTKKRPVKRPSKRVPTPAKQGIDSAKMTEFKKFVDALLNNTNGVADRMDRGDVGGALKAAQVKLTTEQKKVAVHTLSKISMNDLRRAAEALAKEDLGTEFFN